MPVYFCMSNSFGRVIYSVNRYSPFFKNVFFSFSMYHPIASLLSLELAFLHGSEDGNRSHDLYILGPCHCHHRMRHIDVREGWVQQIRNRKNLSIHKILGTDNPSDFFTKIMAKTEFARTSINLNGTLQLKPTASI